MQTDGNLVINDKYGEVVWETNTSDEGEAPHRLVMQSDGNLAIIDRNSKTTWCTATREPMEISNTSLKSETINSGESLQKCQTLLATTTKTSWRMKTQMFVVPKPIKLTIESLGLSLNEKKSESVLQTNTYDDGEASNGKTTGIDPIREAINISDTLVKSDTIYSGESLEKNESLLSTTECFATLKPDGNFVLYFTFESGVTEIWSTKTSSTDAEKLTLNNDGNLVLTDVNGNTVWATKTSNIGEPPYRLTMQSDGNLVVYDKNYEPTWATNTDSNI